MSDKTLFQKVRDAIIGPPPPKVGERLAPEVKESFKKVDDQAALLHNLARRMQRLDERKANG